MWMVMLLMGQTRPHNRVLRSVDHTLEDRKANYFRVQLIFYTESAALHAVGSASQTNSFYTVIAHHTCCIMRMRWLQAESCLTQCNCQLCEHC